MLGDKKSLEDNGYQEKLSPGFSGHNSSSKHTNGHPVLQTWDKFLKFILANISGSITVGEMNYPSAH